MDNNNQNRNGRKRPSGQNIGVLALILVITLIAVTVMNNMVRKNQTQELGYEEFVEYLKEGEIDTAKLSGNRIYLTPKTSSTKLSRFIQYYTVRIPDSDLAERLLSFVLIVQPSGMARMDLPPALIIGSIVKIMPGFSSASVPRRP